jgi:hypothetical protein
MKKIFYLFLLISPLLFISSCEEEEESQSGYNCISNTCTAVFESPQYLSLDDCLILCQDIEGYSCNSNECFLVAENPQYSSLDECQSMCAQNQENTFNYNDSLGNINGICFWGYEFLEDVNAFVHTIIITSEGVGFDYWLGDWIYYDESSAETLLTLQILSSNSTLDNETLAITNPYSGIWELNQVQIGVIFNAKLGENPSPSNIVAGTGGTLYIDLDTENEQIQLNINGTAAASDNISLDNNFSAQYEGEYFPSPF